MLTNYMVIDAVHVKIWRVGIGYHPREVNYIETGVRTTGDDHLGSVIDELADPEFYADVRSRPQMVAL